MKKTKLAFFDVDGVLSAPRFGIRGVGMDEKDWIRRCVAYGDSTYDDCGTVGCVYDYAKRLKADGAKTYVLTAVSTSFEADAKRKFVAERYPGAFDGFVAVATSDLKKPVALEMAKKERVGVEETEIVEDDYATLIEFAKAGAKATHVANVAAGWPSSAF